ncbi:MAG: tRNA (adenosine(37)-N6)-threonylcarbamoyltransferase complex ATPase subunit type 1 TsaE [Myxococcales bacterium]|nr:tRNA (adenosine(37)-N6)-threonylcarbamoyltransferase complex ATPase subunit type 1 TsaE [Myxococcales bacterium]
MKPAAPIELATRRETTRLAARLAPHLSGGDLVVLSGELGAGKTFFVRALCRALGLPGRVRVTSPTFSLVHEHATQPPIAHADLYRLSTPREVRDLGLDHQRDDGRLLIVEWGEPFIEVLGGDALVLTLGLGPRRAVFRATGARSRRILAEFSQSS